MSLSLHFSRDLHLPLSCTSQLCLLPAKMIVEKSLLPIKVVRIFFNYARQHENPGTAMGTAVLWIALKGAREKEILTALPSRFLVSALPRS